jgi:hypothetical protein
MLKGAAKSKTIWFNLIALAVLVASAFGYQEHQPAVWVNEAATVIITLGNLGLRFVTKSSLTDK